MQNHKAMKYFSGNAIQRLPLYKVAMGAMALLLCAGVGVSAMAAAFIGTPPAAQPQPQAVTIATAETAAPTPAPTATPTPDVPVYGEISVVQQAIGVLLYYMVSQTQEDGDFQTIDV